MIRYCPINPDLFINNRNKLMQTLAPNSLAILNANDVMPTNADGVMPFRQNSDLFYLSGIDQEETILVLFPDACQPEHQAMLFLKETNEHIMIWEGQKHTKKTAQEVSGINNIYWLHEFEAIFAKLMGQAEHVYGNTNEHPRANNPVQTRDERFIQWCKSQYPLHPYKRLAPLMEHHRAVKSLLEIALIKEACHITEKGFKRILPLIKPGIMEYEIEAELLCAFVQNRSRGFAYEPIVASGANACILHYGANNQACQAGTTILLDTGAEYANYCADLTRVIPVNGRFSERQKAVYKAVLRIMRQAQTMLIPGNDLLTYHQALGQVVEQELIGLRLLDRTAIKNQDPNNPAYKKYFMHGVSHHIGLNTHDLGNIYRKFEPGMVLTIEPGIYIQEENLGIRLENDFVVRDQGPEDLMAAIPIELEEIEDLMH